MPVYTGETPTKPNDSNYSYQFIGWSPALAVATADAVYTAQYQANEKCGANLYWLFDESTGTLTISGRGGMYFWEKGEAPWYPFRGQITVISLPQGLTSITNYAFTECAILTSVIIPDSWHPVPVIFPISARPFLIT